MRIENSSNPIRSHQRPEPAASTPSRNSGVANAGSGALTSVDLKSMESLLSLVGDTSEVREAVVADIKLKVQAGEFLAQQSAVETASDILNL